LKTTWGKSSTFFFVDNVFQSSMLPALIGPPALLIH